MAARKADGLAPATRRQMSGAATISDFSRGRLIHFSLLFHRPCRPCNGDGNRQWESLKHLWIFLLFRFILFLDFYDFSIFIASLSHLFSIFSPKQEVDLLFFFVRTGECAFIFPLENWREQFPISFTAKQRRMNRHFETISVSMPCRFQTRLTFSLTNWFLAWFSLFLIPFIHLSIYLFEMF